jgi:type II secretory pathway predicted ATPase ExeA
MTLRQLLDERDRVFSSYPNASRYFPAASSEDARRRLSRSVQRGEGPAVVIGAAGTGKSLLLQLLAAEFRTRFDVVLLANAQLCGRRALLQAIHFELGLEYRCRDEGRLRLNLMDQLLAADQAVEGLLLLVDEAQSLPIHLLEELRVLTNMVRGGAPRVRLVLAGLPSLEEKLACPELASLSQRLATRCYLGNLTREETAQFVRAQLAASSADPDQLIAPDAWAAVFEASDGVPRLVNQLCDRAVVAAVERNQHQIDRALVQLAWADLQQLPMPWDAQTEGSGASGGGAGVIEFGALDADATPAEPASVDQWDDDVVDSANAVEVAPLAPIDAPDDAIEVDEPTELDKEDELLAAPSASRGPLDVVVSSRATASSPPRRPRVFRGFVPEAVDPFADEFDEEVLVLDRFAPLSDIFHADTPTVANRHEPEFAKKLRQAADRSKAAIHDTSFPRADVKDRAKQRPESRRSAIRLAFPTAMDAGATGPHESLDERVPPYDADEFCDAAEPVLIIEDDLVASEPAPAGARRENYRHLFSRLRHGA